jgi:hypothetical protein
MFCLPGRGGGREVSVMVPYLDDISEMKICTIVHFVHCKFVLTYIYDDTLFLGEIL